VLADDDDAVDDIAKKGDLHPIYMFESFEAFLSFLQNHVPKHQLEQKRIIVGILNPLGAV
jgi:hypothetical protein